MSELSPKHFPAPFKDIVAAPLLHDTPGEIAQRSVKDWKLGECEPVPGQDHAEPGRSWSGTT